jgi:hypothetical protein
MIYQVKIDETACLAKLTTRDFQTLKGALKKTLRLDARVARSLLVNTTPSITFGGLCENLGRWPAKSNPGRRADFAQDCFAQFATTP